LLKKIYITLITMKLSLATVGGVFAAFALARPAFTNLAYSVKEGVPFTLTWANQTGPVTITVMTGNDPNTLKALTTIDCKTSFA
jgi:hypothetical protein